MKLVRHSLYNLLGLGLPLVVAVFCIPVLIRELGEARFGLLTLIWAVVSYFGLFDLGLGRALTQLLAVAMAENDEKRVGSLVATATALMAALGIFAGLLMALLAPWGVGLIQSVPDHQEVVNAVLLMALAMPAIVLTSGFRGVLEARHAFGIINAIRLPMGLFTFLGPVLVVLYGSTRLDVVTGVLAVGRIVACAIHAWYAWRVLPENYGRLNFRKALIRPLYVSGGWMTVSNVVGPIMGYLDRFVVGILVSAQAVAYYATPQEIVSRLSILPTALMSVAFPKFSQFNLNFDEKAAFFINKVASLISILCVPVCLAVSIFSPEILELWIGSAFSNNASKILSIMACGTLINCISFVPLNWLQATGRSDRVAIVHMFELPIFLGGLWFGIHEFGIEGAVYAWVLRITLDAGLLWLVMVTEDRRLKYLGKKYIFQSVALSLSIYFLSAADFSFATRTVVVLIVVVCCIYKFIQIVRSDA